MTKTSVFEAVVIRLFLEPDFRERFFCGDPEALVGYDLTSTDGDRLSKFTREKFHMEVGGLVTHLLMPVLVAERFAILPSAHPQEAMEGRIPIRLSPGWAFGNGTHATTELSLSPLARYLQPGDAFLDIGTGTGILSIAAARLGAAEVWAYDLDPEAVELARKNVALNGVEDIVLVERGSLDDALKARTQGWNLVAVNILGKVLLDLMESGLAKTLKQDGILIGSAIKADELESILGALNHQGLEPVDQNHKSGWYSVVAMNRNDR